MCIIFVHMLIVLMAFPYQLYIFFRILSVPFVCFLRARSLFLLFKYSLGDFQLKLLPLSLYS